MDIDIQFSSESKGWVPLGKLLGLSDPVRSTTAISLSTCVETHDTDRTVSHCCHTPPSLTPSYNQSGERLRNLKPVSPKLAVPRPCLATAYLSGKTSLAGRVHQSPCMLRTCFLTDLKLFCVPSSQSHPSHSSSDSAPLNSCSSQGTGSS